MEDTLFNDEDSAGSYQAANKSLSKVMMVLDCFSRGRGNLTPAEITEKTGLPRATTHRLLASLRDIGLLEQNYRRDSYKLGMRLFQLGSLVLVNMDLEKHASPHITQLQQLTGEIIHLCVFDGSQMVFVEKQETGHHSPKNTVTRIEGSPVYCTGVGKAFLAWQSSHLIEKIIADGLHPQTPHTITDGPALMREMQATRERGYAIDDEECELNLRCVAVPIRDSGGRVFGAISVSGPGERMPDSRLHGLAPTVIQTADAISSELGWRNPALKHR